MLKLKEILFGLGLFVFLSSQPIYPNNWYHYQLYFRLSPSEYRSFKNAEFNLKADLKDILLKINKHLNNLTFLPEEDLFIPLGSSEESQPLPTILENYLSNSSVIEKDVCFQYDELSYNNSSRKCLIFRSRDDFYFFTLFIEPALDVILLEPQGDPDLKTCPLPPSEKVCLCLESGDINFPKPFSFPFITSRSLM